MSLLEHLTEAGRHLKEATKLAEDWRVRDAAAGSGTTVQCAIYIQRKIASGKTKLETQPPFEKASGANVERGARNQK